MSGVDKYPMRDLLNIILTEGRTAPLYHGTELASAVMILRSDTIEATHDSDYDDDPLGVSTSRTARWAMGWGAGRDDTGHGVLFVLDQAKLATRYRIVPHAAMTVTGERLDGEDEEVVIGTIKPLSAYLLSINVNAAKLATLLEGGPAFEKWLGAVGDLMAYPGPDLAMEMLQELASHPLLNRMSIR